MRISSVAAIAAIVISTCGATAALAAPWSSTTCGAFTAMGPKHQAQIAMQISRRDVSKIATPSGGSNGVGGGGTPVKAGNIVSACQAASATTTLGQLAANPGAFNITKGIN